MPGAGSWMWWARRRTLVGVAVLGVVGLLSVAGPPAVPGAGPGHTGTGALAEAASPPAASNSSYAVIDSAGGVMTFGGAGYYGDTIEAPLNKPVVGGAADPHGGYWMVASDGGIFAYGAARFYGSTGAIALNKPVVGMAATPDGGGYWLVASDGGIFAYGDAPFYGSTGAIALNKPVVGMAATPDGRGYWLVAADGGIFAFGDAPFWGSTGAIALNKPVVGMAATSHGAGYWLVASDGGIFSFGDAPFWGSAGGLSLNEPVVGMAPTPDGGGYWLVGQDAGVFTYGDAAFSGSAESPLHPPLFPAPLSLPIPAAVSIINDLPGPQLAHAGGVRTAFTGDSLSLYEAFFIGATSPPYAIDNGAAAGCGFTNGASEYLWSNTSSVYLDPTACAYWADQLQWVVSRFHPDVVVIQTGYWECQQRLFDGSYQTLADADYGDYIRSNLESAVQIAHSDGAAVVLSTSPYFGDGTPNNLVDAYNQILGSVASRYQYVSIVDVHSLLDPGGTYQPVVDGVQARTPDGVHLTRAAVDDIIEPALNPIIANVSGPVYAGNS
jgi:hypothetical protein